MLKAAPLSRLLLLLSCFLLAVPGATMACETPRETREATSELIETFISSKKMNVLTFAGYSGARYQDPAAMLEHASRVLDRYSPAGTMINIGATVEGIGGIYALAKRRGFTTISIASSLARDEHVTLSPCVDYVFFVKDPTWGGQMPGSTRLSPTSAAIIANSTSFVFIGGGDVARDEMLAVQRAGKSVTFIPADMNHQLAREKAVKRGLSEPLDFRGAAYAAFVKGN